MDLCDSYVWGRVFDSSEILDFLLRLCSSFDPIVRSWGIKRQGRMCGERP